MPASHPNRLLASCCLPRPSFACRGYRTCHRNGGLTVPHAGVLSLPATPGDVLHELGEVAGGVQVTVEDQAAGLALESTLGEGELGFPPAAGRADLGGGIAGVGDHQPPAAPDGLVGEQATHLPKAGVGDGASKASVAEHPGDVELLYDHGAVLGGEGGGELVQRLPADVGCPGMRPGPAAAWSTCAAGSPAAGGLAAG
jgi:hypothetical protein